MATGVTLHSEEEVNRAPVVVPGSRTLKGNRWEMDVTANLFRNYRMMQLLETRWASNRLRAYSTIVWPG